MPSVLQSPRLRRILVAYTVNRLGTWIGVVALSLAVFDHTHSAIAVGGLLIAGQVLPAFAVPIVVARVEASSRRGELTALYVFEGIVAAGLGVLLLNFWLPGVLLLAALDGTAALAASALLRTAMARAARDDLVPRGELPDAALPADIKESGQEREQEAEQKANAALNVGFSATFVLGPAAGGALVAGAGATTALLIDAASFLICGALLIDLHPHVEEAAGASVTARLRAAWSYVKEAPALKALLVTQAVALVFFESAGPIEVAYAKATLHAGDGGYGLLVAIWGAGVVLGSVVFARAGAKSLGALVSAGTLAVGLAYVGFAVAPTLAAACGAAFIGGLGNGVQWAPLISAVQRLTPPRLHGRVMGALESIGALAPALGLSLGAALVALASPRFAFLVVGVGASLTTIRFARIVIPAGVEPERNDKAGGRGDGRAPRASRPALGEPTKR
ncbi:MAG: transporter [Solirubrobacterales bacterium]|nr:transporter [Solirubrobacterales bacterium]